MNGPPRVIKPARVKQYHHKARTGCEACKRRRVKCDEGKPQCEKCLSIGGIDCIYNPPKAIVFESKASRTPAVTKLFNGSATNVQSWNIQPKYSNNNEDKFYLDYFINHLSIRYNGSEHQRRFWRELLPQASWHCEGVKHALVALSMIQKFRVSCAFPLVDDRCYSIVRRKHSQAITYLTQMPAQGSSKMMSIESLLFASVALYLYDFIGGNLDRSWIHLKASWKLIRQYTLLTSTPRSSDHSIPPHLIERVDRKQIIDSIGPLLEELMPHSCLMADTANNNSCSNAGVGAQLGFFETPYESIETARSELFACVNAIFAEHEEGVQASKLSNPQSVSPFNHARKSSSPREQTNGIPSLDIWIHRFACSEACATPSVEKAALEKIYSAVRIARGVLSLTKPSETAGVSEYGKVDPEAVPSLLDTKCSLILAQILDIAKLEDWSSSSSARLPTSWHFQDVKLLLELLQKTSTDLHTQESVQNLLLLGERSSQNEA